MYASWSFGPLRLQKRRELGAAQYLPLAVPAEPRGTLWPRATVNLSGKLKGRGSYVQAPVGSKIQSLYRIPCPPLIWSKYPE